MKAHARQQAKQHALRKMTEMKLKPKMLACELQVQNITQFRKELSRNNKNDYCFLQGKIKEMSRLARAKYPQSMPERIAWIVKDLLEQTDYKVDQQTIFDYLTAYQEVTPLTEEELWWLKQELEMQLLEAISDMCDAVFDKGGQQIYLENAIAGLRRLDQISFQNLFRKLSLLEQMLNQDPTGIYPAMDDAGKAYYRKILCKQAKKEKLEQVDYGQKLLDEAKAKGIHVGTVLFEREKNPEKNFVFYKCAIWTFSLIASFYGGLFAWSQATWAPLLWGIFATCSLFPVLQELSIAIMQKIIMRYEIPRQLPRLDFSQGIPKECATMVMIPALLSSEQRVEELCSQLEVLYVTNGGENVMFALVGDLVDADRECLETDAAIEKKGQEAIKKLNEKYGKGIFLFYLRKRTFCKTQNRWLGWERKRGAILQFNRYMLENPELNHIHYVVTLDADTKLKIGSVQKMVGTAAHPLNRPVIDEETGLVVKGYGIFQPVIATELQAGYQSRFANIFAGNGGSNTYDVHVSDFYMDLCGEGIYTGKGIYDLQVFQQVLEDTLPDNLVLSHDLLEGSYLRCGFINDIELLDGFPAKYSTYSQRLHRWIRGDWQLFPWLRSRVAKRNGTKVFNPLNGISKWKIYDNLRRSWTDFSILRLLLIGLFFLPGEKWVWVGIALLSYFIRPILERAKSLWTQKAVGFSVLPYSAYFMTCAAFIALYRLLISKKNRLEWVTAADLERKAKNNIWQYYKTMWICIACGIGCFFSFSVFGSLLGLLWLGAPALIWYLSNPLPSKNPATNLQETEQESLMEDAWRIWNFFSDYITSEDHHLPPDNVQMGPENKVAHRTSPTNIGFYLLSVVAAKDMGFIDCKELEKRIACTISTLEKMEKWHGHLYNWYDTISLEPLLPQSVSTVDSGNLQGYLLTVAYALQNAELAKRCERLAMEMDFSKLYDKEKNLFFIDSNRHGHYDLLMSEARQTSFLAIALRQVPQQHWNALGRPLVRVNGHNGLASWSGTTFEYLMPDLLLHRYEGSLNHAALHTCVLAQRLHVKAKTRPWGISESGYYAFDEKGYYQYKAFGVPELALQKEREENFVISPYSSVLALSFAPKKVFANLCLLKTLGAYGAYGYYEAVDFTPSRTEGKRFQVVKSYMAHHMGMSLLSIYNFLYEDGLKKYFSKIPAVQGADYLLTEPMW